MTITNILSPAVARMTPHSVACRKSLCAISILMLSAGAALTAAPCQAQDTAEAARQERARKAAEQTKSKHVYTDEDLRRSRILTPEDQAKMEARRKSEAPAPVDKPKPQEALDATTTPAEVPLGDVARRFREQKQARASRTGGQFHLPMSEPALAAPVAPLQPKASSAAPIAPVRPPRMSSGPVRRVDPFAKRLSPFVAPAIPPRKPAAVATPSASVPPGVPAASAPPRPSRRDVSPSVVQPKAPLEKPPVVALPADGQALRTIVVQPGDSLWKLAEEHLGAAWRWQEVLAVNPGITDANRIAAGTRIVLPNTALLQTDTKIVVQAGDTLSHIAHVHYRNAKAWQCIAQANPQIADANRIVEGQELLLPAACR